MDEVLIRRLQEDIEDERDSFGRGQGGQPPSPYINISPLLNPNINFKTIFHPNISNLNAPSFAQRAPG